MGVHTGEAEVREGNYFGGAVNRAARVMAIAEGGQILVSRATEELVADHLPADVRLVQVGEVVLRGLERPEQVYQVVGPGLPSGFSPPEEISGPVSLPRPVTTLFGRADEMTLLERYLARSQLVTVVGFGGVGKTRLATEVAQAIQPNFRHGVWFCDLSSISAAEAVPSAVAHAIGAVEEPGRTLQQSIIGWLSGGAALVLLDNCEHLLRDVGALVDEMIGGCTRSADRRHQPATARCRR